MDELVFQRETLRRALLKAVEQLEKAAAEDDPEGFPTEDLVAALLVGLGLRDEVAKYLEMVTHRAKQRAP